MDRGELSLSLPLYTAAAPCRSPTEFGQCSPADGIYGPLSQFRQTRTAHGVHRRRLVAISDVRWIAIRYIKLKVEPLYNGHHWEPTLCPL